MNRVIRCAGVSRTAMFGLVSTLACSGNVDAGAASAASDARWPGRGPEVGELARSPVDSSLPILGAASAPADTVVAEVVRKLGDETTFFRPTVIGVIGEQLIVADPGADTLVVVIDRRSGNVLRRIGRRGQGPGEFIDPRWFAAADSNGARFWVYDFQLRRLTLLDPSAPPRKEYIRSLNVNNGASLLGTVIVGERIWANGLFDDYSLAVMDSVGHVHRRVDLGVPFPATAMPASVGRRQLNRTFMAQDPYGRRLALLYQWINRADLVETASGGAVTARGPTDTRVEFFIRDNRFFIRDTVSQMAYVGAAATRTSVFGLHCGCASFSTATLSLHQWDWSGTLVRVMRLPVRARALAVSPDNEILLLVDDPEPHIVQVSAPRSP
jgi:hypothetical protein